MLGYLGVQGAAPPVGCKFETMKPLTNLYGEIISLENLFRAAEMTLARGRRFYGDGACFKFNLEREIFKLGDQLARGKYRHGKYRLFTITDPKPRAIAAAPFRDRVLHHAVHDVIEPRVDKVFIYDSYACRKRKGTHRAVSRAHSFLRANRYALHLDVRSYFQNIHHDILKGLLRRIIADTRAIELLEMIIDSTRYLTGNEYNEEGSRRISTVVLEAEQLVLFPEVSAGEFGRRVKGLPLGNLTSQFFANLYLNELDQYVKHELKARYYIRYMDDMALFDNKKEALLEWEQAIRVFAARRLKLELHPSGGPVPASKGLSFLGFRIFSGYRKLKRTSVSRFIQRMNAYTEEYFELKADRGEQSAFLKKIRQSTQSFNAHALYGNTYRIRKLLYDRFPIINQYGLAGMKPADGRHAITVNCGKDV